jgi:hypothetical protein
MVDRDPPKLSELEMALLLRTTEPGLVTIRAGDNPTVTRLVQLGYLEPEAGEGQGCSERALTSEGHIAVARLRDCIG